MRAIVAFYLACAIALGLAAHLFVIQIRNGSKLATLARDEHLETNDLPAQRGAIEDRNGTVLASSLPARSVYVAPAQIDDPARTARALAAQLPELSYAQILAVLRSHAGYVQLAHKIPHDRARALATLDLPGVTLVVDRTGLRFDPSGRLAPQVLGFTGFEDNGLDGAEYAFDSILRGRPGTSEIETDEFGRALPFARPRDLDPARAGDSLVLTLDSYLQFNADRILAATVAKWHARSGVAIVMDPESGAILALSNEPSYDLRAFERSTPDERRDRAVADLYEPGSTFKLITAAAAIDSGKVQPQDRFPVRDTLALGGYVIHNAEDGFMTGTARAETLGDIIAYSHNVGAAEVALRIGRRTFYDELLRFGFDRATGVGLPGDGQALFPPLAAWSATTAPTIAFGQGIAIAPLSLVRAYCAIANGGWLLRPRILDAILAPDGRLLYRYRREVVRRAISTHTAAILRGYLRGVVVRGTGDPTARVPGYTTAGKTGTAQIAENGSYESDAYVASFIGMIPAVQPRFVILFAIFRPRGAIYGSEVAAPAFAQLARLAMLHAGIAPSPARSVPKAAASKASK